MAGNNECGEIIRTTGQFRSAAIRLPLVSLDRARRVCTHGAAIPICDPKFLANHPACRGGRPARGNLRQRAKPWTMVLTSASACFPSPSRPEVVRAVEMMGMRDVPNTASCAVESRTDLGSGTAGVLSVRVRGRGRGCGRAGVVGRLWCRLGCGVSGFAQPVKDLIALAKELGRLVAGRAGCVGGGEVVFDALDGGGRLLEMLVGGAEVLS